MADAYGAVVLSQSEDCKLDAEKLLDQLNSLEWSNSGEVWTIENGGFWYGSGCQYPTVVPTVRVTLHYQDEDGTLKTVPWDKASEEQLDAEVDTDTEEMSLEMISKHFQDCILKGSITIAATCNEKSRYVEYQAITIDADGCVSFVSHFVGTSPEYDTSHNLEEYSPS